MHKLLSRIAGVGYTMTLTLGIASGIVFFSAGETAAYNPIDCLDSHCSGCGGCGDCFCPYGIFDCFCT